ncbi:MAG: hypothetical protein GEU28_14610 [Dehalococcoidia bacterium]|nr:hypothetical protein [Dehalococcoidia bacterium]
MTGAVEDMDALLSASRAIKEDADRLLREFGVLEQLASYGEVSMGGSYRLNLMLNGDIDLGVVNAALDLESALDALTGFIRRGDFYGYEFLDSVRHELPWGDSREGYFLNMERLFLGRKWTVEIMLARSAQPSPDWIEERLTEEGRRTILLFKHLRNTRNLDIPSHQIYKAVLLDGVADFDSFLGLSKPGNSD